MRGNTNCVKLLRFVYLEHLGGSLKACPERSRMGVAWGWLAARSAKRNI